ncbi:MAG: 2-C-methyl-D-erythritol 4-phosphate cytidylyltransferase [Dehalococcoidia bacterium]|nr:2-C-methyl-D-erythritol 4-phosphate cytidylyltransferase [Dehalococcoidia bacterium]
MGGIDKIFTPVAGRPLLWWTIDAFERSPLVNEIVVAVERHSIMEGRALLRQSGWQKVSQVCRGGARRQDSVREALWRLGRWSWVAVHDGARPCFTPELLERGLAAAQETGAAVPGLPVSDTLKRVDSGGRITGTVDRAEFYAVQTPQVFRRELLWSAHERVLEDVTDDAMQVEQTGVPVCVFPGESENVKVTVPQDLERIVPCLLRRSPTPGC